MSLRFALLGLLARESQTGYDLTKRFDSSVGFFWSAKHSQIYPELASLAKDGLVTFEVVTQTSKPNKKVYTLTPEGHAALLAWVAADAEKRSVKDPMLMKVYVAGGTAPAAMLPQLRDVLVDYERRLACLDELERTVPLTGGAAMAADDPRLGPYLALSCGRRQYLAYRDWLIETIAVLEACAAQPAAAPSN